MNQELIAVMLAMSMLGSWWIGIKVGRSRRAANRSVPQFDGASIALLGLLLAFAFGTSMSKHDQRRLAVVQDSNAIGDFYTCASLLKEPVRTKLQRVIRTYAEQRLNLTRDSFDHLKLNRALVEFEQMHSQMTALVDEALSNGTPIAVSLTNTLNAVTSNQAARLAAFRDRLSASVIALMFVAAVVTTMLIGRSQGFSESADPIGVLCFVLMVSFTIYTTLDLNRPEGGFIRVSQEPIERLVSSMAK